MRVKIRNNYDDKYRLTVSLPAAPMELYDMLDRIGVDNHYCNVYMNIDDERIPKVMQDGGFYDDIFRMNLLAQRLEEMPPADTAGFTAVLYDHEEYNLTDLLLVTYGLDAYPIYPCKNYAELGEIVIDNNMIPEVEKCPDELIPYLDKEAVGRCAAGRFKGVFAGGYYCEVADFTPPDMKITINRPKRNELQVLMGTDERSAQWYALPYRNSLSEMKIFNLRSPLPKLKTADDLSKLNEVAERISELDSYDLVKVKAIMESNYYRGTGGALTALDELGEYQFDKRIRSNADFGREYLRRQLPDALDLSILSDEEFESVGSRIIERKGCFLTSYGALSGLGQELYSAITVSNDEELEEVTEVCLT